jgi:hypothetical protein
VHDGFRQATPSHRPMPSTIRRAGRFAQFITTFFALARAGLTNKRGLPRNLLQLAVTFGAYRNVIYGTQPPMAVQRILFAVLVPIGRLFGYRPDVPYEFSR